MLIVAAGGSSNCVVVHDTADSQVAQQFSLPEVRLAGMPDALLTDSLGQRPALARRP